MSLVRGVATLIRTLKARPALVMGLTALMLGVRRDRMRKSSQRLGLAWRVLRLLQSLWPAKQP